VNRIGFAKVTMLLVCDECDLQEALANSVKSFADHDDLAPGIQVFPIDVHLSVGVTTSSFRRLLSNHAMVEIGFLIPSPADVRSQVLSVSTVLEKLKETLPIQQAGYELFDEGLLPAMWPQPPPPPDATPDFPAARGGSTLHISFVIDLVGVVLVVGVALGGAIWYCRPKPGPAQLDGGVSPYNPN
jgi:hypothetical protein